MSGRVGEGETKRRRDLKPCYSVVKNGMRNGI